MSQRSRFQPPELYSIHQGTVTRIEPYGCFVKLSPSPTTSAISGLVHISHLHSNKISDVNDVVNLDDLVFVKVIDVQVEQIESDRGDGHGGNSHNGGGMRQRHKIKLSMKYVHQDTGEDLDKDNLQLEEDMFRTRGGGSKGRGGNSGNPTEDGTYGANSQLGRALASNIGMSSALDPGNLILKGRGRRGIGSVVQWVRDGRRRGRRTGCSFGRCAGSSCWKEADGERQRYYAASLDDEAR